MGKEELQETQEVEACVDGASEAATLEVAEADYLADGDRDAVGEGHHSGMPCRRHFVPGGDDPRDAAISETICGEERAWNGKIFGIDVLKVELPDGRPARRDVVRHPGAVSPVFFEYSLL